MISRVSKRCIVCINNLFGTASVIILLDTVSFTTIGIYPESPCGHHLYSPPLDIVGLVLILQPPAASEFAAALHTAKHSSMSFFKPHCFIPSWW